MAFRISDIAEGRVWRIGPSASRAERSLPVRLGRPVASFDSAFSTVRLPRPMRLWEVSHHVYGEVGLWWALADWNGLPRQATYYAKYLPAQFEIRYMSISRLLQYARRDRRLTIAGAGEVLPVEPLVPTPSAPTFILGPLSEALADLDADTDGLPFFRVLVQGFDSSAFPPFSGPSLSPFP